MASTTKTRSNIYLDTELKENAKQIFKKYGLSLSDGINFLLKQVTNNNIPMFDLDIEPIYPDDPDYKLMRDTDKDKTYTFEEAIKILGILPESLDENRY